MNWFYWRCRWRKTQRPCCCSTVVVLRHDSRPGAHLRLVCTYPTRGNQSQPRILSLQLLKLLLTNDSTCLTFFHVSDLLLHTLESKLNIQFLQSLIIHHGSWLPHLHLCSTQCHSLRNMAFTSAEFTDSREPENISGPNTNGNNIIRKINAEAAIPFSNVHLVDMWRLPQVLKDTKIIDFSSRKYDIHNTRFGLN